MLGEYGGTVPDKQLIEEIGLALAVHRMRPLKPDSSFRGNLGVALFLPDRVQHRPTPKLPIDYQPRVR